MIANDTLSMLAAQGVERLAVAAPGFSADCLNDGEAGMAMLEGLVRRELGGWE